MISIPSSKVSVFLDSCHSLRHLVRASPRGVYLPLTFFNSLLPTLGTLLTMPISDPNRMLWLPFFHPFPSVHPANYAWSDDERPSVLVQGTHFPASLPSNLCCEDLARFHVCLSLADLTVAPHCALSSRTGLCHGLIVMNTGQTLLEGSP